MRTDRRTDVTKLIATLRHFANAPKKKKTLASAENRAPACSLFTVLTVETAPVRCLDCDVAAFEPRDVEVARNPVWGCLSELPNLRQIVYARCSSVSPVWVSSSGGYQRSSCRAVTVPSSGWCRRDQRLNQLPTRPCVRGERVACSPGAPRVCHLDLWYTT